MSFDVIHQDHDCASVFWDWDNFGRFCCQVNAAATGWVYDAVSHHAAVGKGLAHQEPITRAPRYCGTCVSCVAPNIPKQGKLREEKTIHAYLSQAAAILYNIYIYINKIYNVHALLHTSGCTMRYHDRPLAFLPQRLVCPWQPGCQHWLFTAYPLTWWRYVKIHACE